uniref:Anaphase-promoting complex subunit 4-like WD40 domain-containing protein n=1 Tax=Parascaris equorum TaxID=6256 RepID=A0A914S510_PAREQ
MAVDMLTALQDENYEGEWKSCNLIGDIAENYGAAFKVYEAVWSPSTDLIALASKKGEICMRQYRWKQGWKVRIVFIYCRLLFANNEKRRQLCSRNDLRFLFLK